MTTRKTFWLLLVIIIIASFLRLYHLESLPPGLYPDEAMNGNNALEAEERFLEGAEDIDDAGHGPSLARRGPIAYRADQSTGHGHKHCNVFAQDQRVLGRQLE